MAKRPIARFSGWSTVLAVIAVVAIVWGFERWRKDAARRAGSSEEARLTALARCLLGPDGTRVMRSPDAARRRLRALAMNTPLSASVTWFDRCVPLARSLSAHASEVDNTRAVTAAESRVAENARQLAEAVARIGLVWRIRAGDPEVDMDIVADRLSRVASEIHLAAPDAPSDAHDRSSAAPDPPHMPSGTVIPTPGLEPAPLGTPERFLVGAPLPSATEVVRGPQGYRLEIRANQPSVAWHLGPNGLTRLDVLVDPSHDGLAPLGFHALGQPTVDERITPVNDAQEGLHVALDAVQSASTLWLAEWTPWAGTVLARFSTGRSPTAVTLAPAPPDGLARARHPVIGRTNNWDEHLAVASLGAGAVVAYTEGSTRGETRLVLASTLADADRAPVVRIAERETGTRAPGLEFCPFAPDDLRLVIAAQNGWTVLRVSPDGADELLQVQPSHGGLWDSRVVVRCTGDGLLAYAREHTRQSPVLVCGRREQGCHVVRVPDSPEVDNMPLYVTRTPSGRALAHGDWPVAIADADDVLVIARAVGPVVSIARRPPGAEQWQDERVIFDAASAMHGITVEGMDVYASGRTLALAVSVADGLHVFTSDDAGATWR